MICTQSREEVRKYWKNNAVVNRGGVDGNTDSLCTVPVESRECGNSCCRLQLGGPFDTTAADVYRQYAL